MSLSKNFNVPNTLTILRIMSLPVLVASFFYNTKLSAIISFLIFIFGSVTDYIDGVYARRKKQMTALGQFLDPLADKMFVIVTVTLIIGFGHIERYNIIAVILIMCREIIVSDIRNITAMKSSHVKTSMLSKIKTVFQMTAIGLILLYDICKYRFVIVSGEILLWVSALISVISCALYFRAYKEMFIEPE